MHLQWWLLIEMMLILSIECKKPLMRKKTPGEAITLTAGGKLAPHTGDEQVEGLDSVPGGTSMVHLKADGQVGMGENHGSASDRASSSSVASDAAPLQTELGPAQEARASSEAEVAKLNGVEACVDVLPPSTWTFNTCKQQVEKGSCAKTWFINKGLCKYTCGVCTKVIDGERFTRLGTNTDCAFGGSGAYEGEGYSVDLCAEKCKTQSCTAFHFTTDLGDCTLYSGKNVAAQAGAGECWKAEVLVTKVRGERMFTRLGTKTNCASSDSGSYQGEGYPVDQCADTCNALATCTAFHFTSDMGDCTLYSASDVVAQGSAFTGECWKAGPRPKAKKTTKDTLLVRGDTRFQLLGDKTRCSPGSGTNIGEGYSASMCADQCNTQKCTAFEFSDDTSDCTLFFDSNVVAQASAFVEECWKAMIMVRGGKRFGHSGENTKCSSAGQGTYEGEGHTTSSCADLCNTRTCTAFDFSIGTGDCTLYSGNDVVAQASAWAEECWKVVT